MVEVVSRQRRRKMDCDYWQAFGEKALAALGRDLNDATIAFVSNRQMQELNKLFRGVNKVTDVLSFPVGGDQIQSSRRSLGDIAISVECAEVQAVDNGLKFEVEIAQLMLHGLLHLCGYDHEIDNGEMNRTELKMRRN